MPASLFIAALILALSLDLWLYSEWRQSQMHVTFSNGKGRVVRWDRPGWMERLLGR